MAKARHVSSPTFVRRFKSSHSSAQARILFRPARGNMGGGFVVSTGGKGGNFVTLSPVAGASTRGAGVVVEAGGSGAVGCLGAGLAGEDGGVLGFAGGATGTRGAAGCA